MYIRNDVFVLLKYLDIDEFRAMEEIDEVHFLIYEQPFNQLSISIELLYLLSNSLSVENNTVS